MANHLHALLSQWYPERDSTQWVLGTVYKTEGPCYRKAGAMMLFSGQGLQAGMLSGGCLESDIQTHARQVMQQGRCLTLCYDGSDEDDLAFQLGIGCGGTVHILLQPISQAHDYLQLDRLYQALCQRQGGHYHLSLYTPDNRFEPADSQSDQHQQSLSPRLEADTLITPIQPQPHLLVAGGGIDARPLVALAHQLGWYCSLWDPRPANGRREFFPQADQLLSGTLDQLGQYLDRCPADGAVLMSHNINLDAGALALLRQHPSLRYLALLGPLNRKADVLSAARISESALPCPLAGPAGLSLGGDLPESIALSILSECHAALYQRSGGSFSDILKGHSLHHPNGSHAA